MNYRRLAVVCIVIVKGRSRSGVCACLIFAVERIDILDKLPVEEMKRDILRTNARTLTAVGASSCNVESADNVEHILLEAVGSGFIVNA